MNIGPDGPALTVGQQTNVLSSINALKADAASVLALLASNISQGGNSSADAGKFAVFGAGGTLKASTTLGGDITIAVSGFAIAPAHFGFEAGLFADSTVGYSSHLVGDSQTGVALDGNGGTNSTGFQCNLNGVALKAQNQDGEDQVYVNCDGTIFYFYGAYKAITSADVLTANRIQKHPDAAGTLPVVPAYVDLTAANAALDSGDFWWDSTLKKLRVATA